MWSLPYSGCLGITTDLSTIEVIVVRRETYLLGGCRGEDVSHSYIPPAPLCVPNVSTPKGQALPFCLCSL